MTATTGPDGPARTSDRILLHGMRFRGCHGTSEEERRRPQPFELDVELWLDLSRAGRSDDLSDTVDYSDVFRTCRRIVEDRSLGLLETIAETLASEILASTAVEEVTVTLRKLEVPIEGEIAHSGVEIRRSRPGTR